MKSRRDLLKAHYLVLARKAASWTGLISLVAASFIAMPVQAAGQLTSRSVTLSTPVNNTVSGGTNVSYAFKFTFATSGQTVASFKMEICDSPLSSVACANSGSSAGATFTSATSVSTAVNSGTWANGTTCSTLGTHTGNSALVNCTSGTITLTPTVTVTINGVTNPTANGQYYVRISSYNSANAGAPAYPGTDFGAVAVDTTQQLSETATVQENLLFAVGQSGSTCANVTGTTVTLSPAVMTTSAPSSNTGVMCANTNAASGYSITYTGTPFTGSGGTITAFPNSGTSNASSPGTEQFGFNLKANTTPSVGSNPSGGTGTCTGVNSNIYCTANSYAYDTASNVALATAAGPSADTLYTMSFVANVAPTTKAGVYTATQTFICTGTF